MKVVVLECLTFGLGRLAEAAKELDIQLYLFTQDPNRYAHELAHECCADIRVVPVDTFDFDAIVAAADNLGRVDGVVNLTDTWCFSGLDLANELGVPCQDRPVMELIRNKSTLRNHLFEKGLSRGPSTLVEAECLGYQDELEGLRYPVIIKDAAGTGSRFVWKASNYQEASHLIAQIRHDHFRGALTIEPYFEGPLYSVETVSWQGQTRILTIASRILSDEPHFREDVCSLPVSFSPEMHQMVEKWIAKIYANICYDTGFAHSEFIMTNHGLELVEVNGRLAGAVTGEMLCRCLDVNVYQSILELAIGRKPELLQHPLQPSGGFSQVLLYAQEPGRYQPVDIDELVSHQSGIREFFPIVRDEMEIDQVHDYRGLLGILLAEGDSTEIAIYNAMSAANKLRPKIHQLSKVQALVG